jgi:hypothetical protein
MLNPAALALAGDRETNGAREWSVRAASVDRFCIA